MKMIQNTTFGSGKAPVGAAEFKRLCKSKSPLPESIARKGIKLFGVEQQSQASRATAIADLATKFPGLAKTLESKPEAAVPTPGRVHATIRKLGQLERVN